MEWLVLIGIGFVIAVIFSVKSENKKKKKFDEDAKNYSDSIEASKKELLTGSNSASLPVLDASAHSYRTVGKENLLAIQNGTTRMEMKSTGRYRTGGASVSIPIVKGVRYRVGSGSIKTEKEWQATATGRLIVTDKAISFESSQKNERITWTQVADIELMLDGFQIAKRSGPPRTYLVDNPDPQFAAIVELMLSRTD